MSGGCSGGLGERWFGWFWCLFVVWYFAVVLVLWLLELF